MSTPAPTPDGERPTSGYASSNGAVIDVTPSDRTQRLIVLGYIMAFAIPPMGLILGIVLAIQDSGVKRKHLVAIIVLSIVALVVWLLILASGVVNTTGDD